MARAFKFPSVGVLWNKYYSYDTWRIKEIWYDKMAVFSMFVNEPDPCPESVVSWHYLMALTELLKMRQEWDHNNHCPME